MAVAETGAARLLEQKDATPETVAGLLVELIENAAARESIKAALARWHSPQAAQQIAEMILRAVGRSADSHVRQTVSAVGCDDCEPTRKQTQARDATVPLLGGVRVGLVGQRDI
jgi:hypothetical protein